MLHRRCKGRVTGFAFLGLDHKRVSHDPHHIPEQPPRSVERTRDRPPHDCQRCTRTANDRHRRARGRSGSRTCEALDRRAQAKPRSAESCKQPRNDLNSTWRASHPGPATRGQLVCCGGRTKITPRSNLSRNTPALLKEAGLVHDQKPAELRPR